MAKPIQNHNIYQAKQINPTPSNTALKELLAALERTEMDDGGLFRTVALSIYLNRGGNPNVIVAGKLLLHKLIEDTKSAHHSQCVKLLIEKGASITTLAPNGHNALSWAFEINALNTLKLLINKQAFFMPRGKLTNGFLQAVDLAFFSPKKIITAKDFVDINGINKSHACALHLAVQLNNTSAIKKLLQCGANPLIKNNEGDTPLKIAYKNNATPIIKMVIDHYLHENPKLLKLSDFTLFKAKGDGITSGGFYKDPKNIGWLIKEGHSYKAESVVKEYIAGALFQILLGNNAPQTEIVIDEKGTLLIGSKLLPHFQTISDHFKNSSENEFAVHLSHTFKGKPVEGFYDAIAAITFLKDSDAHFSNVGLIDHGNKFSFAKIDHGFSLNFFNPSNLEEFRDELDSRYEINMDYSNYDKIYQSIARIAQIDFATFETTVHEKMVTVKSAMQVLELDSLYQAYKTVDRTNNLTKNLETYEQNLITGLKQQHEQYQQMTYHLSLEKAIVDHDAAKLNKLLGNGINLETPFKPFFNPTYLGFESKDVTGKELIKKYWPELLQPLPQANVISPQDIFIDHESSLLNLHQDIKPIGLPVIAPAAIEIPIAPFLVEI